MTDTKSFKDHDLLIEVNTKLERVIQDINDLKNNVASRVDDLEKDKLDKEDNLIKELNDNQMDHEKRLRRLERWGLIGLGVILAVQAIPDVVTSIRSLFIK